MTKFLTIFPDLGDPGARVLHPAATGVDITLTGTAQAEQLTSTDDATITDDLTANDLIAIASAIAPYFAAGTNPAQSGPIRIPNNVMTKARNAGNSADLDLIGYNSSNNPVLFSGLTGVLKAVSSVITAATIVNADVSASAAIAYSKLALALSIVNGDISASAAIAWSKIATSGAIVNADVNASAAIDASKIAVGTFGGSSAAIFPGAVRRYSGSVAVSASTWTTIFTPASGSIGIAVASLLGNAGSTFYVYGMWFKATDGTIVVHKIGTSGGIGEDIRGNSGNVQIQHTSGTQTFYYAGLQIY